MIPIPARLRTSEVAEKVGSAVVINVRRDDDDVRCRGEKQKKKTNNRIHLKQIEDVMDSCDHVIRRPDWVRGSGSVGGGVSRDPQSRPRSLKTKPQGIFLTR